MQHRLAALLFALLVVCLVVPPGFAVNKIYSTSETAITFGDSAQTPSATITLSALASGAGRISARYDRGAGAHAAIYKWRCSFQWTGTNVVGEGAEVYISTSDGTNPDSELGTADAALVTAKRNNLLYIGSVVADQTTTATTTTGSGLVYVPDRYFATAVWNAASIAFVTSTSVHHCSFIPWPQEIQ